MEAFRDLIGQRDKAPVRLASGTPACLCSTEPKMDYTLGAKKAILMDTRVSHRPIADRRNI